MKKIAISTAISTAIVAAALATSLSAASAGNSLSPRQSQTFKMKKPLWLKIQYNFACFASGGGTDFGTTVIVINKSTVAVPAGTKVRWKMAGKTLSGVKTLPQLAPGKGIDISNALPQPLATGHPCTVRTL